MKIITLRVADELYDISKQTSTSLNKTTKNIIADYLKSTRTIASFPEAKTFVLPSADYMSLKTPTKDQIKRLVDRIEIDKDKKVYVYLKFPELLEEL